MNPLLKIIVGGCLLSVGSAASASEKTPQVFDFSLRDIPIYAESATAETSDAASNHEFDPSLQIRAADPTWLGDRISFGGDTVNSNGDYRGSLDLAAKGITGGSDALSLRYNRFLAGHAEGSNHGFGFGYSFPSRFGAINVNGNLSDYEDSVTGGGRKYQISGDRQAVDASLRRHMFELGDLRFDALMGLAAQANTAFTEGERVDDASRHLSSFWFETQMNCEIGVFGTSAFSSVSVKRGLTSLGADRDPWPGTDIDAEYRKYTVLGSLKQPLGRWNWGLNGQYQYSPDIIPGSQYMLVAGPAQISGFGGQGAYSQQGGWLRLEASSPWFPLLMLSNIHSSVRLSLLKGWVAPTEHQPDLWGSASAAEIALQLKSKGLTAGLRVGRMLGDSLSVMQKPDTPDVSLTLSISLK
ncbi:MAG: ShlB/FhaC/HecB family hemolysin secretion/activation protein [Marinobacter sp.]|uniref:ShlB/FhaC/HecB family hemolysin secretion/activation protein n=1 Tax=Marinobacter sp. TaxID=50741 RepID=UPI0034A0489A